MTTTRHIHALIAKTNPKAREYRWFHWACWVNEKGDYTHPAGFHRRAVSDYTVCHCCRRSINGKDVNALAEEHIVDIRKEPL